MYRNRHVCTCIICTQDIEHLETIWELGKEWEGSWDEWKIGQFESLKTDDMTSQAQGMLKKLAKTAREIKVHT